MKTANIFLICLGLLAISSCGSNYLIQEQSKTLDDFGKANTSILPDKLVEISGLQVYQGDFLGFNDSGGAPEIYKFDDSNPAVIQQTIGLENALNVDWESIAMSDSLIFIGDFGNNIGNRKELNIYYIPRDRVTNAADQTIDAHAFSFFYPEQKNYDKQAYQHDFDMEAMVYYDKKLHLFTKEWKSEKTHHYTLDLVKGNQPAWLVEGYDVGFFVTGADVINLNKKYTRLGLVGYTRDGDVYMLLTDFKNNEKQWLNKPKTIIHLGFAGEVGQVEGISFKSAHEVCYSAEKITMDDMTKDQNLTCFSLK